MCIQEPPYLMLKLTNDSRPLVGNERYEGYIADMLERLATKADFSYIIRLVGDNKFGRRLDSGRWNGMIREVMESVSNQTFQCITR